MDNVTEVAKEMFGGIWDLFVKTNFPGTNVSLAAVLVAVFLARFSVRLFGYITGFHGASPSDYGRAGTAMERIKSMRQKSKTE